MQVTQADLNNIERDGVLDEHIKFRPSPNFKNMKKFLKNRSDYTDTSTMTTFTLTPEPVAQQAIDKLEVKPVVVQPPLPPYPPPVSPPILIAKIKQEKEDNDVQISASEESNELLNEEPLTPKKSEGRPKKTMCKEFIRGECQRPVCRFSHQLDLSQLRGVFTFCWNYQNARCTFPYCKFVHASIFEEAEFYRTGNLPLHARSHLKKSLPLPHPPEENHNGATALFTNRPPAVNSLDKQVAVPLISCIAPSSIEQRTDEFNNSTKNISPLKREWSEIDSNFGSSPRDIDTEHLAKKCKNCGILEFRLQYYNEKMDNMVETADELKKIEKKLGKKTRILNTVLEILMTPVSNMAAEKEKTILEHLTSLVHTNSSLNTIFGNNVNVTNLVAKLLRSMPTADQTLPVDSSRET